MSDGVFIDIATLTVAIASIVISLFTFWWTSVRKKGDLYLIPINAMNPTILPEFALVNGGDYDVLFTHIVCGFSNAGGNGTSYPPQTVTFNESTSNLLESGKAFHCKVSFNSERFGEDFAKEGRLSEKMWPSVWLRDMTVSLAWVRSDGKEFTREVRLYTYGFSEAGELRTRTPIRRKNSFKLHRAT